MAKTLAGLGYRVLVLDTDESNPGLYRALGLSATPKPLQALMSRFSYKGNPEEDSYWIMLREIKVGDIASSYLLSEQGITFLIVGKIEDSFQGSTCSLAEVTRGLVYRLSLREEVLLIDLETGVKSFGPGVERGGRSGPGRGRTFL